MSVIPSIEVSGTHVRINRLGFGCARLFGGSETRASARLIETALDCGIRHFDTAPSYGDGCSEQVLGEVLRGVADVTLASKIGIPRPAGPAGSWRGRWYRRYVRPALAQAPGLKRRLLSFAARSRAGTPVAASTASTPAPLSRIDPGSVARELEITLSRLRREALDLYLLHEPECIAVDADLLAAFADLRRQGLIRAFGCAFGGAPAAWPPDIDLVQSHYFASQAPLPAAGPARIFHGVMRQSVHEASGGDPAQGPRALAVALRRYPRAAFLFSASTPGQIREVMVVLQREGVLCGS
jgi:aryl-alcohol dehydrogenase-like predicted oxidoreductase